MSLSKLRSSISVIVTTCLLFIQLTALAQPLNTSAVASAHPQATKAGIEILQQGGNAFDAAAAVSASLAVVEPYGSGLGGGGFWLLHRASDGHEVMIDGREKAPGRAHKNMYLDDNGSVIKGLSVNGPMAAGIPGVPAAIEHLVEKYGRLDLKQVLAPAIKQARQGFDVTPRYQALMGFRQEVIASYDYGASIFLRNKNIPALDETIVQADLADTLQLLAEKGRGGFYDGDVALKLVNSVQANGGIWEREDLLAYDVIERQPVTFNYHDNRITSAMLPSSGGVVLGQALQILEHFELKDYEEVDKVHIVAEAMRRAYRDRAAYLGDADFVDVPIKRLLDRDYTEGMALTIDVDKATPSSELADVFAYNPAGENTTHFSIIDNEGNRVSATLSINLPFGSGFVADGTGVILNNEMDDFSIKPYVANSYGLIGDSANAIAAGKRPLSSMTPTFVENNERVAILGTPGGSRIISMVLLGVLDFVEGRLPESWVSIPRYHHQYMPDQLQFELGGLTTALQQGLQAKGHVLRERGRQYGNMQAIMLWKPKGLVFAASDPRGEGEAQVIYLSR